MAPVAVDGLVVLVVGLVDGVEVDKLVVEAVLAGQDDIEAEISKRLKRPNQRPNKGPNHSWLVKTWPIRTRNVSFWSG